MSIRTFVKGLTSERWNIGFINNSLESILRGDTISVKWLKHSYKDRWFADPFILSVTEDEIIVLVEEFYKPIQRGRLARLLIDRKTTTLMRLDVILELDTHLSFPIIERNGDEVYIYPENGESGNLTVYKYYDNQRKCEKVRIISNEALADSVKLKYQGINYLFATPTNNPNGNTLRVYSLNDQNGMYEAFKEYSFKENTARMAGDFFMFKEKLYRPAQECNVQYGHAVVLQEVINMGGEWCFEEVRRLYSVHPNLNIGMHTFNMYDGMIVTDALGFDRMWIRTILKIIGII